MAGKHKILIVDDERINIALLTSYLSEAYDVTTAKCGEEGLEKVKAEEPDLILLDVIMPGIDGFDVCRIIKQEYKLDFIPIIMLTALTSREYHQKGIEVGADDFLKKPADQFELNKKIKTLLRIKEQHDSLLMDRNKAYEYLDYVNVLVAVLDSELNLVHINKKGSDILGYSREEIINRNWMELFVAESYEDHVRSKYESLLNANKELPAEHEYPIMAFGNKERLFRWNDSLLINENNENINILISGEDITEKRNDEIKIMKYAEELKRSNELKDLFTDVLRHDLLNPAGLTKSFIEILEDTDLTDRQKRLMENIKRSNIKLIELIEDAAHLAKLESMEKMAVVKFDIPALLKEVLEGFPPSLITKTVRTELDPDTRYSALANPMIQGVFSNLISNAIKYSPENTIITLKIDDVGERWKISVIDQGDGIPEEQKLSVFTRFKRLHKENIKGSGIGLAIVKRIIDLHGENVGVVDNPEGKGCIFWFTLQKAHA